MVFRIRGISLGVWSLQPFDISFILWSACITLMKELTIRNSLWLSFFLRVFSEIPCSVVSRFVEASYLTLITIQLTGCNMMQNLGVGDLRRLQTVFYLFFFCLRLLYFYVAPFLVFFETTFCWLFRYLLILIGLLTCI